MGPPAMDGGVAGGKLQQLNALPTHSIRPPANDGEDEDATQQNIHRHVGGSPLTVPVGVRTAIPGRRGQPEDEEMELQRAYA